MNNEIKQIIDSCDACQTLRPSQPKETLQPSHADGPMDSVSVDLFHYGGKEYLVMVDRYSGFTWVTPLSSTITSKITSHLLQWFLDFGFPQTIRSDGGPQFRSEFDSFLEEHNIIHEVSSPYNPKSNGSAEAAVKNMKHLLDKCQGYNTDFMRAFAKWRNTPKAYNFSLTQLMFGGYQ